MPTKRLILALLSSLLLCLPAAAQTSDEAETLEIQSPAVRDIVSVMPSNVKIHQSRSIQPAFQTQVESNSARTLKGYRVRIFNDNSQNARKTSEDAVTRFGKMFPAVESYRTFTSPFFKVTVGDFRSKSEAMQMLQRVIGDFPSAFVVKENINYPILDLEKAFTATVTEVDEQQRIDE